MRKLILVSLLILFPFISFAQDVIDKESIYKAPISLPLPIKSEYFKTSIGGYDLNFKNKEIKYILGLDIIKPFKKTVFVEALFENPENKLLPLVVNKTINSTDNALVIYSPPIHSIKKGRDYNVSVLVYENEKKEVLITKHIQMIQAYLDDKFSGGIDEAIKSILAGNFSTAKEILQAYSGIQKFDFPSTSSLAVLDDFKKGIINEDYIKHFFKGLSYHRNNEFNAAIKEFQDAVAVNSKYPHAYLYLGIEYISLDMPKEAVVFFTSCLQNKPDYAEAYWGMASSYDVLGESQKTEEYLQKAKKLFQQQGNDSAVNGINNRLKELEKTSTYDKANNLRGPSGLQENIPTKTWKNQEEGVEIKYPYNWFVKKINNGNVFQVFLSLENIDQAEYYTTGIMVTKMQQYLKEGVEFYGDKFIDGMINILRKQKGLIWEHRENITTNQGYKGVLVKIKFINYKGQTEIEWFGVFAQGTTMASVLCEGPAEDFYKYDSLFKEIIMGAKLF